MGKASKFFRKLLGLKKPDSLSPSQKAATPPPSNSDRKPSKRRWSFVKSSQDKNHHTLTTTVDDRGATSIDSPAPPHSSGDACADDGGVDPSKHAIAVAAATAAVADATIAAAQAAAEVVRLTSSGRSTTSGGAVSTVAYVSRGGVGVREEWAAIKIQSSFRAYLSRRALRALKALVRLQARVRGHIVRKQTADMLHIMQTLIRAQARALKGQGQISESPKSSTKSSQFHPCPATPEKFEHAMQAKTTKQVQSSMLKKSGSKSNGSVIVNQEKLLSDSRMDEKSWEQLGCSVRTGPTYDEKSDKILEVDSGKPHFTLRRRSLFQSSHHALASDQNSHSFTTSKDSTIHQTAPSPSSCEVQSSSPLIFTQDVEEIAFCTPDNSPQFYSASSKGRGPFTPTKSDGSRSYLSGYADHPNYMAYTESSRAKLRSLSAPRQRTQFERPKATKRCSVHVYADSRSSTQRVSALHANFTSKAYPGSGRLDRLGMPVGGDNAACFSGGHWNRY